MNDTPSRILIIKPGAIGDLLHITPVIRALKGFAPDAAITVMVGSKITKSLFNDNPMVNDVIVFDKKGEHRKWLNLFALWKKIRDARYDLVLNYQRSNLKGWFLVTAAFPCRVLVYHKLRHRVIHAIEDHLRPLELLGVDPFTYDKSLDFFPSTQDEAFADNFIRVNNLYTKKIVAFNPGTSHASKCWPIERFIELGNAIAADFGCEILLLGSPAEKELTDTISKGMQFPVHDLCGCSLGESAAVLKRCELLVTGDTGPMHIATAVNVRVLALYGPISPVRSGPVGDGNRIVMHEELDCCPCNSFNCKNNHFRLCMELITVEEVKQALAEMLTLNNNEV
ncbi:MAG: glycosyltransferase family 9 protein [Geobacteraceae bacterium]|nr:glycosyltransferase family 9 protein [Geobacteraceae bacterium]